MAWFLVALWLMDLLGVHTGKALILTWQISLSKDSIPSCFPRSLCTVAYCFLSQVYSSLSVGRCVCVCATCQGGAMLTEPQLYPHPALHPCM